jgi:hypothetical protein
VAARAREVQLASPLSFDVQLAPGLTFEVQLAAGLTFEVQLAAGLTFDVQLAAGVDREVQLASGAAEVQLASGVTFDVQLAAGESFDVQLAASPEVGATAATANTTAVQSTIRTRLDGFCSVVPMSIPLPQARAPSSYRFPAGLTRVDTEMNSRFSVMTVPRTGQHLSPIRSRPRAQPLSSAVRSDRTYSRRLVGPASAASTAREPTTTPSASAAAARASSGLEMPKPA